MAKATTKAAQRPALGAIKAPGEAAAADVAIGVVPVRLEVRSVFSRRRRAGIQFTDAAAVTLVVAELTQEQIEAIKGDPMLKVREIFAASEETAAPAAPDPGGSAAPAAAPAADAGANVAAAAPAPGAAAPAPASTGTAQQ